MQTPIGIDQFWKVLGDSNIIPPMEVVRLRENSALASSNPQDAETIANWMVSEKILTPLQKKVLLAGHHGPFNFGRYRLISGSENQPAWLARDQKTAHPVWLHFFPGETRDDLSRWDEVENRAEQFAAVNHPNIVRVYENIVTPTHRFVATAVGGKEPLAKKMPLKRRLSEKQALVIIREVATALAALQSLGLQHGSLSLEHVYSNAKQGTIKVLPPVSSEISQPVSDTRSLGRMLFRLLVGRDAPETKAVVKAGAREFTEILTSRKVSDEVAELVFESVTADESFTAEDFSKRINAFAGQKKATANETSASETTFLAGLTPWKSEPVLDDKAPQLSADSKDGAEVQAEMKQSRRTSVAAPVGFTLLGFAALLGIAALLANLKTLDPPRPTVAKNDEDNESTDPNLDAAAAAEVRRKKIADLRNTQSYVQEIIVDDQQSLWESPTTGFPIDISKIPPAPRIIAAVNWKSIHESETGLLSLKALGPKADSMLRALESRSGFSLTVIESTIVSLHSNIEFEYEAFASVTLSEPATLETCIENWNQPDEVPGIENAFEKALGDSWWVTKTDPESGKVISFVVGSPALVQQVAQGQVASPTGTLRNLVANSDRDRDVNLIMPLISLFNTEGQALLSDQRKWMNELRTMLPESVAGLSLSLHHDEADYLEIRVDHTSDLKANDAAVQMKQNVASKLEQTQLAIQQRQALPYWEPIRARFSAMIRDLSQQLRWDVEFDQVIGNAWLAPGAMHNLVAGTELAMTFEPTEKTLANVAQKPATPNTLEELLATRRDLKIANPPDLNVLLRNIREEVSDQYLDLPFEFNIRIAGTDLQKDGITQNQRPGPLQIVDRSVAEILTQVMVSANPNREISGAADPKCKLVWVIMEDSESPGKKIVLITTRAAAAEKGYALPEAFKAGP